MPSAPDIRPPAPSTGGPRPAVRPPTPRELSAPPSIPAKQEERIGERDLRVWRTGIGRLLVRAFAAVVMFGERVWKGWSLEVTIALTLLVGGALASYALEGATDVYEDVSHADGIAGLDQPVLDWVVAHRTPASSQAVTWFTDIGGPVGGVVLAGLVMVVLAWSWRRWTPVLLLLPGLLGSLAITIIGKDLTGRGRPPLALAVPPYEVSPSFPSGHTLNATVLAGLTAYLLVLLVQRVWLGALGGALAAIYALTMGLSRVWLGHHWLTDVVAGWLLGAAWVVGVITVHRIVLTLRGHHVADPATSDVEPQVAGVVAARPASSLATGTRKGEQET